MTSSSSPWKPRWTIGGDGKVYSDREFALILRKTAELARASDAGGDAPVGLTLDEMKAAAAEAGFDPDLVERAARLAPGLASRSLFERLLGGPLLHEEEATFASRLTEERAARLLSAVRSTAGRPGTGESSPAGMSWHSGSEGSDLLVTAHSEPGGTRVSVRIDRSTGLLLTSLATAGGIAAAFFGAIGVAQETAISPYLVLTSGVGGSLALARAFWASSTRTVRRRLASLMETVDRALEGHTVDVKPATTGPLPKANLAEKLSRITEPWTPRLAARVNETDVKLVKLQGEFIWHRHEAEDELFLVLKGRLLMQFRDREEWIEEGEIILVPRGVEHRPVAPEEAHVLLVEPSGTLNTGDVGGDRTVEVVEPI